MGSVGGGVGKVSGEWGEGVWGRCEKGARGVRKCERVSGGVR